MVRQCSRPSVVQRKSLTFHPSGWLRHRLIRALASRRDFLESTAKLIASFASLAWPVVFSILIFKLFDPLKNLIESARSRKFTLKVAGNELSMDEASEQQRLIISDLQAKVAELERHLSSSQACEMASEPELARSHKRILWVDDRPSNNSYLAATIEDRGASIVTVLSTDEALSTIRKQKFDIVISDMGRPEGDHAGLDLTRKLKQLGIDLPVYIFCGGWASKNLRSEAKAAGVSGITSSATTLLSMLPLASRS